MNNIILVFIKFFVNFDFVVDELSDVIGDVCFINFFENVIDYIWLLGDGIISIDFELEYEYDINRVIIV